MFAALITQSPLRLDSPFCSKLHGRRRRHRRPSPTLGARLLPTTVLVVLHLALDRSCDVGHVSCTCIEHIYLDTGDRTTGFVLPKLFLKGHSPRLRTLVMIGVFPPSLLSLLLSPTRLTDLCLDGITDSSHLSPRELLMHLSNMPQLRYLNIGFWSTPRHRRLAGDVT
jgi:hypothetical protein